MKKFVFVFLIVLFAPSSRAECEDCFIGAWDLESITSPDGVVTTPGELGVYSQIQFLPDQTFIRLENMEIVSQGQWYSGTAVVHCEYGGPFVLQVLSTSMGDNWVDPILVENNDLELLIGCPGSATIERYTFIAPTAESQPNLGSLKAFYR